MAKKATKTKPATKKKAGKTGEKKVARPSSKKPPRKASASVRARPTAAGFDALFERLRGVMRRHVGALVVARDVPGDLYVDTALSHKGKPVFFGGVRRGRSYVSYHLFGVYVWPDLLHGVSPALRRRMQGKSCFNFTAVDPDLFAELDALTADTARAFASRAVPGAS